MSTSGLKYRLYYSDGSVVEKSFYDKWAFALFIKNEGDHLVEYERV